MRDVQDDDLQQRVSSLLGRIHNYIANATAARSVSPSSTEASDGSENAARREDTVDPFDRVLTADEVCPHAIPHHPTLLAKVQVRAAKALTELSASPRIARSPRETSVPCAAGAELLNDMEGEAAMDDEQTTDDWPADWTVDFADHDRAFIHDRVRGPQTYQATYVTRAHLPLPVPHHLHTRHLMMKFLTKRTMGQIRGNQTMARECLATKPIEDLSDVPLRKKNLSRMEKIGS